MWSRSALPQASSQMYTYSHYSSTPHLFVYQPCDDDILPQHPRPQQFKPDLEGESGYEHGSSTSRSSSRSGTSYSSTSNRYLKPGGSPTEPIYSSARELNKLPLEQRAVDQIRERYDSFRNLNDHMPKMLSREHDEDEGIVLSTSKAAKPEPQRTNNEYHRRSLHSNAVTDSELLRVEMFFKGHKTQVFVCKSLANLYFSTSSTKVQLSKSCSNLLQQQHQQTTPVTIPSWDLKYTGIPVVLLDLGDTKSRDRRRITFVLAERGTGFTLWKDVIDNLSNYEAQDAAFHTMRLSTDHRQMAGFSFDDSRAAQQLLTYIEQLTSDPANISLSAPKQKSRKLFQKSSSSLSSKANPKSQTDKGKKKKLPQKSDISQPCCFQHVTSVDSQDWGSLFSLQALVPGPKQPQRLYSSQL